jgi:hypothetical protein
MAAEAARQANSDAVSRATATPATRALTRDFSDRLADLSAQRAGLLSSRSSGNLDFVSAATWMQDVRGGRNPYDQIAANTARAAELLAEIKTLQTAPIAR